MPELDTQRLAGPRWGPASRGAPKQVVVICHGIGADGHDLISLAPSWGPTLPDAVFAAPDAPFVHDSGFGRQWWSVADRSPSVMEAGARRAAPFLHRFVDDEITRLGLPPDAYALAGFSQGAMMVLFAGLRRPGAPRAILAYSGALIAPASLAAELANRAPVLLVHGETDETVLAARSREAEAALTAAGVPVESTFVPGIGHGIDETGVSAGALFLQRAFASA
jgi:phospholipase/carboxylesterase